MKAEKRIKTVFVLVFLIALIIGLVFSLTLVSIQKSFGNSLLTIFGNNAINCVSPDCKPIPSQRIPVGDLVK